MDYVKRDIWLLWQIGKDNTSVYLLAIDESEILVNKHRAMIIKEYEGEWSVKSGPPPRMYIEKRESNHLYGAQGL